MLKRVFVNTFAQVVGKAFTATSSLIITILIGKNLGPAGYGQFTQVFVFVGYFYTLVDFGFNSIYVKTPEEKNEIRKLQVLVGLRTFFALTFSLAAIFIAFILPFNPQANTGFAPIVKIGIAIASLTILTHALFTSANAFFQKKLTYQYSAIASTVSALITLTTAAYVSLTIQSFYGYILAYVAGGISLVATAYFLLFKKAKEPIIPRVDLQAWSNMLKCSWPVGLSLLFNLIYFRIDVFILSNSRSSFEVGLYGLAYQIFESSLALPIFFANSIYPFLVEASQRSVSRLRNTIKLWLLILFLISIVLIFFLISVSYLIELVDPRFGPSRPALIILSLGVPFFFLSAVLWNGLIAAGKQKALLMIYAFGAIFNVIANYLTIPSYGYLAAAITTVVSEGIILGLLALTQMRIKEVRND